MAATSWPPSLSSRLEIAAQSIKVESLPARFQHFARSCARWRSIPNANVGPAPSMKTRTHTAVTFAIRMRQNREIMIVLKATSLLLALLLPAAAQHHPVTAQKPVVLYKALGASKQPLPPRNAKP